VPGLIVLCAGFGAGTTAVAVATDMSNGIVDRIRSMPVFGSSLLVGHVVASLARNVVATALVIAAGLIIGWRPSASLLDWAAAIGMVLLFITAISWRRDPGRVGGRRGEALPRAQRGVKVRHRRVE